MKITMRIGSVNQTVQVPTMPDPLEEFTIQSSDYSADIAESSAPN